MKLVRLFIWVFLICGFQAHAEKVFELRTYYTHEGKLPDLLDRFKDHTINLFEKHNMKNIGYWVPKAQKNTLIYIISHENQVQAKNNWQGFIEDPLWKSVYKSSRINGPIVKKLTSQYLNATTFSVLK